MEKINPELFKAPVTPSLLIPCRVAYPLAVYEGEGTLESFYSISAYNLGQVEKCYDKDEALVKEIREDEDGNP